MYAYRKGSQLVEIQDYDERRRIQNLLAQRRWRQKARQRGRSNSQQSQSQSPEPKTESSPSPPYMGPQQQPRSTPEAGMVYTTQPDSHSPWMSPSPQPPFMDPNSLPQLPLMLDPSRSPSGLPMQEPLYGQPTTPESSVGYAYIPATSTSYPQTSMAADATQAAPYTMAHYDPQLAIPVPGPGVPTPTNMDTDVKRKILESLEAAEGLFDCGVMLNVFPADDTFQRLVAEAKSRFLSLSATVS